MNSIKDFSKSYGTNHFMYSAMCGRLPMISFEDSEGLKILKREYKFFTNTFSSVLNDMKSIMHEEEFKNMVDQYLVCVDSYSDELFFSNYSTVLTVKLLFDSNDAAKFLEYYCKEGMDVFRIHYADGSILQYIDFLIDKQDDNKAALTVPDTVELEVGLKKRDITKLELLLPKMQMHLLPSRMEEIIRDLNRIGKLENNENIRNVVGFKYSAFIDMNYPINPLVGLFLNKNTGIFMNEALHCEYGFEVKERIAAALVVKYNVPFLLTGDARCLLRDHFSTWVINNYCNLADIAKIEKMLQPFTQERPLGDRAACCYQCEADKSEAVQGFVAILLADYAGHSSGMFSAFQKNLIMAHITKQLDEYPQLYKVFSIKKKDLAANMYAEYEKLYGYIKLNYPIDHILRQWEILFDAIFFSLAYCSLVVPAYLHNTEMMKDLIEKKLVCADKNKCFDWKIFNESYSEFEIFFYLFSGIFLKSNLHKEFVKLEYESNGNKNKRFEYSFLFVNRKINVEVKALECAPEFSDQYDIRRMKDGTRFYKNYFFSQPDDIVPCEIREKSIRLKSNVRQVGMNIKRINKKCVESEGEVNLGFLMINYGTSREEFLSYLMNENDGYLVKNPLDKIDALILFSMCADTDLLMEEVRRQTHIFVFENEKKVDEQLLTDLRLDNFVRNNDESPYKHLFNERYGKYIGINRGKVLTIQRDNVTEEQIEEICDIIAHQNKYRFDIQMLWKDDE